MVGPGPKSTIYSVYSRDGPSNIKVFLFVCYLFTYLTGKVQDYLLYLPSFERHKSLVLSCTGPCGPGLHTLPERLPCMNSLHSLCGTLLGPSDRSFLTSVTFPGPHSFLSKYNILRVSVTSTLSRSLPYRPPPVPECPVPQP